MALVAWRLSADRVVVIGNMMIGTMMKGIFQNLYIVTEIKTKNKSSETIKANVKTDGNGDRRTLEVEENMETSPDATKWCGLHTVSYSRAGVNINPSPT